MGYYSIFYESIRELIMKWRLNKKVGISVGVTLIALFSISILSYAETKYPSYVLPYLEKTDLFSDAIRWVTWWIVTQLHTLNTYLEDSLDQIVSVSHSYLTSSGINQLFQSTKPIYLAFLGIVIVFVVGRSMLHFSYEPLKKFFTSSVLIVGCLLAFDGIIDLSYNLTNLSIQIINQDDEELNTMSADLILNQLVDVEYLMNNPNCLKEDKCHQLNQTSLGYLTLKEHADKKSFGVFPTYDPNQNEWKDEELYNGFLLTSIGAEYIYRYQLEDSLLLICQLIVLILAYVLSAVKFAKLVFELGFKKVIAFGVGILDLGTGVRFKKMMTSLICSFILMYIVILSIQCYGLGVTWISNLTGVNGYVKLILQIGALLLLLDGPKIVEMLIGMDAGISTDGLQAMHYGTSLVRNVSDLSKGTGAVPSGMMGLGGGIASWGYEQFKQSNPNELVENKLQQEQQDGKEKSFEEGQNSMEVPTERPMDGTMETPGVAERGQMGDSMEVPTERPMDGISENLGAVNPGQASDSMEVPTERSMDGISENLGAVNPGQARDSMEVPMERSASGLNELSSQPQPSTMKEVIESSRVGQLATQTMDKGKQAVKKVDQTLDRGVNQLNHLTDSSYDWVRKQSVSTTQQVVNRLDELIGFPPNERKDK